MKNRILNLVFTCCLLSFMACDDVQQTLQMWYDTPADEWMKSLPIGNGRLGAMVYGGVECERLAINESTMWSGEYDPEQEIPFGRERLDALRKLYFDGDLPKGHSIAHDSLRGRKHSFGTHLPIGDLKLEFEYAGTGEYSGYRRSLNLDEAVASVEFLKDGVNYRREYIASNPKGVLVFRLTADKEKAISFTMKMDMLREGAVVKSSGNRLTFEGQALFPMHGSGGVLYYGCVAVKCDDGKVEALPEGVRVEAATAVTIVANVRTNYNYKDCETPLVDYKEQCLALIDKALDTDYTKMRNEHIADYSSLFSRVKLQLGNTCREELTTEERWHAMKKGDDDVALQSLFFQYARYLLIASSREDSPLPVALQGFFNDNLACNMAWTNDYHLDINTQQNYWISNVGNLAECNTPLYSYIAHLAKYGESTANKVYGCKGWTAHTTANVWGFTAPSDAIWWGLFPTASSWIASHLWTQYEYTQDKEYLKDVAYPLLKGNAEFLLDYMTEDPNSGYLVTGPSISPENSFGYNGGNYCAAMMPTVDRVLVFEILNACIRSCDILGVDKDFADSARLAIAKLPPLRVNKYGGLREWYEDYDDVNINHRHTSHLHAFYPYSQITLNSTPELAKAVENSLTRRLTAEGWEDVEWSRANSICYYARLKKAEEAYDCVNKLMTDLSRENLMTISAQGIAGAPCDIYAFDGNPAGAAGIAEMLLQCHDGYIELLPALPVEWSEGSYEGLCVKGGAEVSAEWKNCVVEKASLKATADGLSRLLLPRGKKYKVLLNGHSVCVPVDADGCINVQMKRGDVLSIK